MNRILPFYAFHCCIVPFTLLSQRKDTDMQKSFRILALLLSLLLLVIVHAAAEQDDSFEPFIRMDSTKVWKRKPTNVRYEKEGLYTFGKARSKYGIDDIIPSEEGMEDLCISGSAQYSMPQFLGLAEELRKAANGKEIWIIDLRRESHGFLGAIAVSWYEWHNWANPDLTTEEIEEDELARFGGLIGKTVPVYGLAGENKNKETKVTVKGFMTEKELAECAGFHYLRIPILDHTWPKPEQIDQFIDFVKSIDMEKVWLHFHCQAGMGRTGIMMSLYDKMKNPEVPMMDILVRQTRLGGSYPLYTGGEGSYKAPLYAEKARMMPLLFQYVE